MDHYWQSRRKLTIQIESGKSLRGKPLNQTRLAELKAKRQELDDQKASEERIVESVEGVTQRQSEQILHQMSADKQEILGAIKSISPAAAFFGAATSNSVEEADAQIAHWKGKRKAAAAREREDQKAKRCKQEQEEAFSVAPEAEDHVLCGVPVRGEQNLSFLAGRDVSAQFMVSGLRVRLVALIDHTATLQLLEERNASQLLILAKLVNRPFSKIASLELRTRARKTAVVVEHKHVRLVIEKKGKSSEQAVLYSDVEKIARTSIYSLRFAMSVGCLDQALPTCSNTSAEEPPCNINAAVDESAGGRAAHEALEETVTEEPNAVMGPCAEAEIEALPPATDESCDSEEIERLLKLEEEDLEEEDMEFDPILAMCAEEPEPDKEADDSRMAETTEPGDSHTAESESNESGDFHMAETEARNEPGDYHTAEPKRAVWAFVPEHAPLSVHGVHCSHLGNGYVKVVEPQKMLDFLRSGEPFPELLEVVVYIARKWPWGAVDTTILKPEQRALVPENCAELRLCLTDCRLFFVQPTAEPNNEDSHTAEPNNEDSHTAEPKNASGPLWRHWLFAATAETNDEPGDSHAAEPNEPNNESGDSQVAEPNNEPEDSRAAETAEPNNESGDSHAAEPNDEPGDSHTAETAEPNNEDSHAAEPNNEDSHTAEPNDEPGHAHAAEPNEPNNESGNNEPEDSRAAETAEPNNEDSHAAEPNNEDSPAAETEPNEPGDSHTAETAEPGAAEPEPNNEPDGPVVGQIYRLTCRHAKKVVDVDCIVANIQGERTTFRLCEIYGDSLRRLVFLLKNSPNCRPGFSVDSTERPYPTEISASECMIRLDHIYVDKRPVCAIDALKWVEVRMPTSTFMDMRS